MKEIEVKPQPGLIVRDPITKNPLPNNAYSRVPYNRYWRRQLLQGSISQKPDEKKRIEPEYKNKSFSPGGKNK